MISSDKKLVFVSNYINHHQIPFCNAMYKELEGSFLFIQTQPMEEDRVRMGWQSKEDLPYLFLAYDNMGLCQSYILEAQVVLFGGCEEESYIQPRLQAGKPVLRYCERLYREGQWKAVSPRGLVRKYQDHTKYRKKQVYLLCAGAYVPSDFHIIRAYKGKMYRWGYFPETKKYEIDSLIEKKGMQQGEKVSLLWAARFLELKHPKLPVKAVRHLRDKGIDCHLHMIGGGDMEKEVGDLIREYRLEEHITLTGFQPPKMVREYMEKADIYLMTSDRHEGWGAVVNEAMNSGCAVVGNHMVGAVPYLIRHGENGLIYRDGKEKEFLKMVEVLATDKKYRQSLGKKAYETITEMWNAEDAASSLLSLLRELGIFPRGDRIYKRDKLEGPCSLAPVIPERKMYGYLKRQKERDGQAE